MPCWLLTASLRGQRAPEDQLEVFPQHKRSRWTHLVSQESYLYTQFPTFALVLADMPGGISGLAFEILRRAETCLNFPHPKRCIYTIFLR